MDRPNNEVYRKFVRKTDPVVRFRVPEDIYKDVEIYAKKNARKIAEEIIARLAVTLQHNDEFMARDRLMRLIYSKHLAYRGKGDKGYK